MFSVAKILAAGFLASASAFVPMESIRSVTSSLNAYEGGFKDTKPEYAYSVTKPDLSDLPITKNLDNIDKITRMQRIIFPQFSWQAEPGDESTRIYQLFAQDISRIGYDDEGRIWSIVCPQRFIDAGPLGTGILEVTVTGVRGWVDEETNCAYADMGVEGVVWLEPNGNPLISALEDVLDEAHFPLSKANAIRVRGHTPGQPWNEFWPMTNGTDPVFFHPQRCQHWEDAFSVYNLQVEIGDYIETGIEIVDDFNKMTIELVNNRMGNIIGKGQKVAWNVWPAEPEDVDEAEWRDHAEKWLHSIMVEHEYPDGQDEENPIQYFDGSPYVPKKEIKEEFFMLKNFLNKHGDEIKALGKAEKMAAIDYIKDHMFEEGSMLKKLTKSPAKSLVSKLLGKK